MLFCIAVMYRKSLDVVPWYINIIVGAYFFYLMFINIFVAFSIIVLRHSLRFLSNMHVFKRKMPSRFKLFLFFEVCLITAFYFEGCQVFFMLKLFQLVLVLIFYNTTKRFENKHIINELRK
jgi:hypothetical protein